MLKWLLFLAAVALVIWIYRGRQPSARPGKATTTTETKTPASVETMLTCERCQLRFPASEAVHAAGKVYCCAEHCPPRPGAQ